MTPRRTHRLWNSLLLAGVVFVALVIAQQPLWSWWLGHQARAPQADWEYVLVSSKGPWPDALMPGEDWPEQTSEKIIHRLFGYEHTRAVGFVISPSATQDSRAMQGNSMWMDYRVYSRQSIHASGWPRLAFRIVVAEGHSLTGPTRSERSELIWSGLIINAALGTLALVAAVLLAFRAIAIWRAKRLSRRKLCPACGYPRGRSPICTECGASLPAYVRLTLSREQPRRRLIAYMLITFAALAFVQVPLWRAWSRRQGPFESPFQPVQSSGAEFSWPIAPPDNGERWPAPKQVFIQRSFGRVNDMAVAGFESARGTGGPISVVYSMTVMRIGWPCEVSRLSSVRSPMITASTPSHEQVRMLGVLINAALAWAIVMAITLGPLGAIRLIRARWRTARNLCPTCAYPRDNSPVCSECGHNFTSH